MCLRIGEPPQILVFPLVPLSEKRPSNLKKPSNMWTTDPPPTGGLFWIETEASSSRTGEGCSPKDCPGFPSQDGCGSIGIQNGTLANGNKH